MNAIEQVHNTEIVDPGGSQVWGAVSRGMPGVVLPTDLHT